jgi:adenosylcobinamide-GDP ribazoletransferase
MSTQWRLGATAPRFMPLLGVLIGAVGGAAYWLGVQLWPTSIALILSMLATALLSKRLGEDAGDLGVTGFVFALLVKYNTLMALSPANLPFALPPNLALGLIMIAGHAASRALVVSILASPSADLGIASATGFAPAALLGIPGLIGLAAAIVARIAYIAYIRRTRPPVTAGVLDVARQLTELCFYLGALASWAYA